ncbi:hypothetical protein V6N12_065408 [Hibiscus sabdariffa]|uniref:Uncharacterized protein n=1 Tax=Hibiscus sabdariffa TaxID=183260 RepID=A0ABR2G9K6_9ROSI
MEARALWMKKQQEQTKAETDWYRRNTAHIGSSSSGMHGDLIPFSSGYFAFETLSPKTYTSEPAHGITTTGYEEKHPGESTEMPFLDKSVTEANQMSNTEDKDHLVVGPSLKIIIIASEVGAMVVGTEAVLGAHMYRASKLSVNRVICYCAKIVTGTNEYKDFPG